MAEKYFLEDIKKNYLRLICRYGIFYAGLVRKGKAPALGQGLLGEYNMGRGK